ncbi:hypothetical protein [Pseudomonas aeruginosa]|uniref:hypothetical protein n=1 Tax=Pseudomonas aeruginosa TaxID=287 RepID=UPI003AAA22C0
MTISVLDAVLGTAQVPIETLGRYEYAQTTPPKYSTPWPIETLLALSSIRKSKTYGRPSYHGLSINAYDPLAQLYTMPWIRKVGWELLRELFDSTFKKCANL